MSRPMSVTASAVAGAGRGQVGEPRRLAWLDALRGIAALAVVFDHLGSHVLPSVRAEVVPWFDPGKYGVMVFFLVSGYVVPASLERRGSIRGFWVSRVLRLYPLWGTAITALMVLNIFGLASFRGAQQHPAAAALAHVLMLQDLLGVPSAVNVLWTLSYEMVFYLILTMVFAAGAQGHSAGFAAALAVVSLAFGGVLPTMALSRDLGGAGVVTAAAAAVVAGLAGAVSGRRRLRLAGAVLAGGTALILASLNGRAGAWETFSILAWMFTGTALYRAERGQISWAKAGTTTGLVLALTVASGVWHVRAWNLSPAAQLSFQCAWAAAYLLAGATFAVGLAARRWRVPRFLAWLGLVSYSLYLLHPLWIDVYARLPWAHARHTPAEDVALAAAFMAVLLVCCQLTYRCVELPGQHLGARLARRLDSPHPPAEPGGPGTLVSLSVRAPGGQRKGRKPSSR